MDNQTKISERNGSPESAPNGLAQDVGDFAQGVLTLTELQAQLFVADLQECRQRVFIPCLILLCGAGLGMACLPIALAALALGLIQTLETSPAVGFLLAVLIGALVSLPLCAIGWFQVRGRMAVLRRSQQELIRNLHWIKKVLKRNRSTRNDRTDNSWRTVT